MSEKVKKTEKKIVFHPMVTNRMVKYKNLNHHGTLFAGQGAEWFVESGFIAASSVLPPDNVVCVKVHGMTFRRPVPKGHIVRSDSRIVMTGKTSLVVYVIFTDNVDGGHIVDGFLTFVHVDLNGKPMRHHLEYTPKTKEEKRLYEEAKKL